MFLWTRIHKASAEGYTQSEGALPNFFLKECEK
jgi:hypothetical protein